VVVVTAIAFREARFFKKARFFGRARLLPSR